MAARKRRDGGSFKKYRMNLKKEQAQLDGYLASPGVNSVLMARSVRHHIKKGMVKLR